MCTYLKLCLTDSPTQMRMVLKGDLGYSKEINGRAEEQGAQEKSEQQCGVSRTQVTCLPQASTQSDSDVVLSWTAQQDEADSYSELKFYQSHIEQDPKKASPILKIPLPYPHEILHLAFACHGFRTIHNSTERIGRIFEGPSPSHQPSGFSTPTAYYQPL